MNDSPFCAHCGTRLTDQGNLSGLCPACLLQRHIVAPETAAVPPPGDPGPALEEVQAAFPEFEVKERRGRGGMGTVFRAHHKELDRAVALKVLHPHLSQNPAFAERFRREARAMARLQHPNIAVVHDVGERDGLLFLTMEYVDGLHVRELLQRGGVKPQEALALIPQICEGLQYAHDQGVVHRDIKPENILVDRQGRVKLCDFGLAKLLDPGAPYVTLTGSHQVVGTLHYMAPEQMKAPLSIDHRADIYSLGVVLYELLTGELPVGNFPPPSEHVQVDVRLDQVVLKALQREPQHRYQKVSEVQTDVEEIRSDRQPAANQRDPAASSTAVGLLSWMDRLPGGAAMVGGIALLLSLLWAAVMLSRPGLLQDFHWLICSYVLAQIAVLGIHRTRVDPSGSAPAFKLLARLVAFGTAAALLMYLAYEGWPPARKVPIGLMCVGMLLFGQMLMHEWIVRARHSVLFLAAGVVITSTVLYASQTQYSPSREAYYFGFGMTALLAITSTLVAVPGVFLPSRKDSHVWSVARGFALAAAAGAFYFHRYLF